MATISVFNFSTINGFYKGHKQDISWNQHGDEEAQFSIENLKSGNALLFGRVTYQMMESFWTTEEASKTLPEVAAGMNSAEKIVLSNTLKKSDWTNTRFIGGDVIKKIKLLKKGSKRNLTILGSGSIVTLLTEHNLIDEYLLMIYPVAIGNGTPMLKGLPDHLKLKLTQNRTFKSGTVLLGYRPI